MITTTANNYKLSEFTLREITSENVQRLTYNNEKVFLGQESDIKLINDRATGKLSKILVMNKNHFKAFEISKDHNSINYQFNGNLKLSGLGEYSSHRCHKFTYHSIDGGSIIWFASRPQNPTERSPIQTDFHKLFWVNLSKAKEGSRKSPIMIGEFELENSNTKQVEKIIKPIHLENPFITSNFFFLTKNLKDREKKVENPDQSLIWSKATQLSNYPLFNLLSVTKTQGPRGEHSKKVFEFFGEESSLFQKELQIFDFHRSKFVSDFQVT